MKPGLFYSAVRTSRTFPRNGKYVSVRGFCPLYQGQSRYMSPVTTPDLKKPYYITTPIFYVNAAPHIGHLYTIVLADILKRWQALLGNKAILCTGTDEHGMKIQQAASKAGMPVRDFCDQNYKSFQVLAERAGVDYDHFIRTSEPDHRFAVQHFWLMLKERGYIYTSTHQGWYSVSDETFYPATQVHLALDPATGRKFMASKETGKEVELTSENNYHFRLSVFKDRLLEFYQNNPEFVVPASRMSSLIQVVTDGLQDLSVSRPVERLTWGIPVPDDESQTIYVWLDALINYLTKANYPFQIPGQEDTAGWPAECQVVGKDIVRFHCIYWPAFLMALDLPLPRQILTHAHWTLGREKMSKSTGNVVNPFFALERFGVDTLRFYLAHDGGIQDDSDYENAYIVNRYKKALQGGLGNLISRVMRGKGWSVRRSVESGLQKAGSDREDAILEHRELLEDIPQLIEQKMNQLDSGAAVKEIMNVIYKTNAFMQNAKPWETAPHELEAAITSRHETIYLCAESLRICGILLQPYMPSKMKSLLDMLGVSPDARMFRDARFASDVDYGTPLVELGKGQAGVLFPPLRSEH